MRLKMDSNINASHPFDFGRYALKMIKLVSVMAVILSFAACSAVFEGGASGKVVDAESTETPKAGIQDVEVYIYTSEYQRNEDFSLYPGNGKFLPSGSQYIGHTTTASDGTFSLNKLMWESDKPVFGKTGDSIPVFLIFYHENYGLQKNDNNAVILSDSVSYVVYQEMTAIRSSTVLSISVLDVSQDPDPATRLPPAITQAVNVKVSVPQTTSASPNADPIVKKSTVTGNGNITVSYPRYTTGSTENTPAVTITYGQSGQNINYKPCNYVTTEGSEDYSFISDFTTTPITRTVQGASLPVQIYMKPTIHTIPTISGQLCLTAPETGSAQATRGDEGTSADDNVRVMLASINTSGMPDRLLDYTAARVMTSVSGDGANNSRIIHGRFSGLGEGITWTDDTYTGRYATKEFALVFDMDNSETISTGDRYYLLKDDTADPPAKKRAIRSNETTRNIGKLTPLSLPSIE